MQLQWSCCSTLRWLISFSLGLCHARFLCFCCYHLLFLYLLRPLSFGLVIRPLMAAITCCPKKSSASCYEFFAMRLRGRIRRFASGASM